MLTSLTAGLATCLSLIVAIGAQNAYVLRQGVRRAHVGAVVAVCLVSDAVLILAGVAGMGTVVTRTDWLMETVRWLGVAFLVGYALTSLGRARHPGALAADDEVVHREAAHAAATAPAGAGVATGPVTTGTVTTEIVTATESRRSVVLRAVALTWLNPHVYLDTVLLLGTIAATHAATAGTGADGRWWFGAGAVLASAVWFSGLGFGARLLAPLLARPRAWQVLEVLVAATMLLVAARLALG
ncbi:LysE family transporter [Nocardioides sp. zg-536]|uniref:LysE family transporter n=1 Tax=Nocardioides faecalis TaxID=2803858 RepID=A0A939BV62_9ACTN|nr:LysE family transporter [Nocardioides faecalis]MBM9459581.1 LysE family transporter [Nocardioides faecalis]QVI58108.1 LysE family transporter [Nocardioides faecalis]